MKYIIRSIDTLPNGCLYVVADFLTDEREMAAREDFVLFRPPVSRRYAGPALDPEAGETPDPADYVEEKFDVAGFITAAVEGYYQRHPELEDARRRGPRWRADRSSPRLRARAGRADPHGFLADPAVQALVQQEREAPRRPPAGGDRP
jgi:hypothetical protein